LIQLKEEEALLLAHETCITKFQKKLLADTASINLTNADRSGNQPYPHILILLLVTLDLPCRLKLFDLEPIPMVLLVVHEVVVDVEALADGNVQCQV